MRCKSRLGTAVKGWILCTNVRVYVWTFPNLKWLWSLDLCSIWSQQQPESLLARWLFVCLSKYELSASGDFTLPFFFFFVFLGLTVFIPPFHPFSSSSDFLVFSLLFICWVVFFFNRLLGLYGSIYTILHVILHVSNLFILTLSRQTLLCLFSGFF